MKSSAAKSHLWQARKTYPDVDSIAMNELSQQHKFPFPMADPGDEGVIEVCVDVASRVFSAGEQHIRAYVALLLDPCDTFVWSMPVVARAALEAFAEANLLVDPGIGLHLRAARVMNLMIDNEYRSNKVRFLIGDQQVSEVRVDEARHMRLQEIPRQKPPSFEEKRSSYTDKVKALLGDDCGGAAYSYWSSVAHAEQWGLLQSVGHASTGPAGTFAPVNLTTKDVYATAVTLTAAHDKAFRNYADWAGWDTTKYVEAFNDVRTQLARFA